VALAPCNYFNLLFISLILFKASIGVKLFTSISFNNLSISDSFSTYSITGSADRDNCVHEILACSNSNIFSIFLASVIVCLDKPAIFATSNQKDFLIPPGITFLKNTRFSSFSQTATEKFLTHFKFFDSSINS